MLAAAVVQEEESPFRVLAALAESAVAARAQLAVMELRAPTVLAAAVAARLPLLRAAVARGS
jgi:hypothetical protein